MNTKQQGSSMIVILIVIVVIAVGAVWFLTGTGGSTNSATDQSSGSSATQEDTLVGGLDAIESAQDATAVLEEKSAEVMEEKSDESMMKDDAMMEKAESGESMEMEKVDEAMMEEAVTEESEPAATSAPAPVALASGSFTDYSADQLALADSGDVVLFFHAAWCPSCRGLERDINANAIPDGVHILKVDYDSATALRQQYGVTRQHTLVVVDSSGNEIKKITSPTNTLAQVVAAL